MASHYEALTELTGKIDLGKSSEQLFNQAFALIDGFCSQVETDSYMIDLVSRLVLKMVSAKEATLSMILDVWKRYLSFLKMYHFAIDPYVCDRFVTLLQEAILSSMESLMNHLERAGASESVVDPKACGVTNFLCQRLSASISFFVQVNKISDGRASSALGTVALVHRVLLEHEQTPEILNKYHNFIGKAIRPPETVRDGALPISSTSGTQQSMPSTWGLNSSDNSVLDNSIFLSILRGYKASVFEGSGEGDKTETNNLDSAMKAKACYATAWLLLKDMESTIVTSSNTCTLKVDHTRVQAHLDFVISTVVVLSVRFCGLVKDAAVRQLMKDAVKCLVDIRSLFVQLREFDMLIGMHSFMLSLSCCCENDVSISRVKSEVGRWVLCGYLKTIGETAQRGVVESFKVFIVETMADLVTRNADLKAVCRTSRAILMALGDGPAMDLLIFLKQTEDPSTLGHFKAAIWAYVPLAALHKRGGAFVNAVNGLLNSSCSIVLAAHSAAATDEKERDKAGAYTEEEGRQRLGQAMTVLSNYGPSVTDDAHPLLDLSAVRNRGVVQFVVKTVGTFSRLMDRQMEKDSCSASSSDSGSLSASKTTATLKFMSELVGCLVGQMLPAKIKEKIMTTAKMVASLTSRLAGLCDTGDNGSIGSSSDKGFEALSMCILAASRYCFRCVYICCKPHFPEEEFEKAQAVYHSLVKAVEVLSRRENKHHHDLGANSSTRESSSGVGAGAGWQLWCALQESMKQCVSAFPSREMLESKARLLIPSMYRPFMGARSQGKTATIDSKQECQYTDVFSALEKQDAEAEDDGASVLRAAMEHSWRGSVARGGGKENLEVYFPSKRDRDRAILKACESLGLYSPSQDLEFAASKRAKTA